MFSNTRDDKNLQNVIAKADCLYDFNDISIAVEELADRINERLGVEEHVVIPLLNGGLVFAGQLLPSLKMPVIVDFMHVTRYENTTQGQTLKWHTKPQNSLKGKSVLILDDIFDEGMTLQAVVDYCKNQGAKRISTAVLVMKDVPLERRVASCEPDYYALTVPDVYVFGMGMDFLGYLRNAKGIFALSENALNECVINGVGSVEIEHS